MAVFLTKPRVCIRSLHTSNLQKGLFDKIKTRLKNERESYQNEFQSWAEFEGRGFRKPEYMNCWIIEKYGEPKDVLKKEVINVPDRKFRSYDARHARLQQAVRNTNDIMVKVHAASVNPIDVRMCHGYGKTLINFKRSMLLETISKFASVRDHSEFPLVLGRDFSGTVIDVGSDVHDIVPGDEVYGSASVSDFGTLSEYLCVHLKGVCHKPSTLSHVEAASIPYVAATVLTALKDFLKTADGKHVLVLGGSGGIGTFAIQLLKAHGCYVSVSCSQESFSLCEKLGANSCHNYKSESFVEGLKSEPKFDLVFDTVTSDGLPWAAEFMKSNGTYTTLLSPVLRNFDEFGLFGGLSANVTEYALLRLKYFKNQIKWGISSPNRDGLMKVSNLIDSNLIKPVIHKVFDFDHVPEAFEMLGAGHSKGKIVVNVSGLAEATYKTPGDRIIHL